MSTITVQPTQPEASTSTSTPSRIPSKHLATFVIDSTLPRSKFKKLIVADGVIHKLVQRLMEKHGGETNLRLCLLITASSETNHRSKVFRKEYSGPLAFLTSLPTLVEHFPKTGRLPLIEKKWPSFSSPEQIGEEGKLELVKDKKRKRRIENRLLDGVVNGIETLHRPHVDIQHSPSRTFISLTPASATPLLDTLHTPNTPTDQSPGSPARRYLVVVASNNTDSLELKDRQEKVVSANENWDSEWDDKSWQDLAEGIKAKEIKCSCVVGSSLSDGTPSKKLKMMCKEASNGSLDAPWFSVPPEINLTLSGYSIETGSTPPLDMASTVATEVIETPISNPQIQLQMGSIGNDAKHLQQLQNQAMQARMAQFAKAVSSSSGVANPNNNGISTGNNNNNTKIDPAMMQSMIQAMKNGNINGNNIDMNDPKWQQVRQLLQLQQQRQLSINSNSISVPTSNNNNNNVVNNSLPNQNQNQNDQNSNVNGNMIGTDMKLDQNVMVAIQQQRAQQAQAQAQNQQQQQPQQQQQQQQPVVQNVQQQQQVPPPRPAQQPIWSGTLSSASQPGTYTHLLNLDATRFSGNTDGILAQHWPKDLQLRNVVVLEVQTLTAYAQAKSCPIVVFTPSMIGQDTNGNSYKYTQLANSLHAKGNMVIIPFGTQDRGIVLFSAPMPTVPPTPNGNRTYKLMGVVCLHVPFPPLNAVNVRSTPTQIPQQPEPPLQQQQQQQQIPQQAIQRQQISPAQPPQQLQQQQQQPQYRPSPNSQQNIQNVNGNNNNTNNANNSTYHQQMLLQAQSAIQTQNQNQNQNQGIPQGGGQIPAQAQMQGNIPQPQQQPPQQYVNLNPNQPQQQQQQQQQYIPQQPQPQPQQQNQNGGGTRGITEQQFTQLILHAQRLGLPIQQLQWDYNNIPNNQLQILISGIKMAESKLRVQAAAAQQQQQQQQNMQQQNIQQQNIQQQNMQQQQQNIQLQQHQQQQQQQMVQLQQMLAQQGQFGNLNGMDQGGYPQ